MGSVSEMKSTECEQWSELTQTQSSQEKADSAKPSNPAVTQFLKSEMRHITQLFRMSQKIQQHMYLQPMNLSHQDKMYKYLS